MRVNLISPVIAKNNPVFGAVSIKQNKKPSQNSNAINATEQKIDSLSAADSAFQQGSSKFKETEQSLNDERARKLDALPWYRMIKSANLEREYVKKEIGIRQESNEEQKANLQKMQQETAQVIDTVKSLKQQMESNDQIQAARKRSVSSFKAGKYRTQEGFSQIAGYEKEKNILNNHFIAEIIKEQQGEKADIPSAVLFFGPKGNGKTTFAKAFAQEIGCEKPIEIASFGKDTASVCENFKKRMVKAGEKAKTNYEKTGKRQVIFIDEADLVSDENSTILPELEDFMRNCYKNYHCIVFAATNYPLKMALPLEGDDRVFPYIISQDPPVKENKIEILRYYLQDRTDRDLSEDEYEQMADKLEEKEAQTGGKYSIARIRNQICAADSNKVIKVDDVMENIENSHPNINTAQLKQYQEAMDELMADSVDE